MSVIIVGGGMAGATLALAISRLSHGALPVHLIEATAPESHAHPGFDGRAIALAAGTCQQLARIGVWQSLADCATAITSVHVSDRGHAGFVTLAAEDYQLAALGQVVELHNVGQRLFALLRKAPGVTLHCPDRVANVARTQSHVEVTLESGETLTGRVLVAADGTHSALATVCGVDWQQDPYEQLAVIANVATSVAHEGRAFERFTQHGPLAMLPMKKGLNWYDYGARHYDTALGRFTTNDRFAEKYYSMSPYQYGANSPVVNIDVNGDSIRICTETQSFGHTWISVGEGSNMTVYSYGRYNGTNKGPDRSSNSLGNGSGVLLKLMGDEAKAYNDKKSSWWNVCICSNRCGR